jgi:phospholipid-binding lipoprotein MlaA
MKAFATLIALSLMSGCVSMPANHKPHEADPYERANRTVGLFNEVIDIMFLKPIAKAYTKVTPDLVQAGVSNFFGNVSDAYSAINSGLQGKRDKMGDDLGRVLLNTTFGLGGIFDLATAAGIDKGNEDFGQTLGYWGVPPGPYLMLPLMGPSTVRDACGLIPTFLTDPVSKLSTGTTSFALTGLRVIDTRAGLLPTDALLNQASLDKYTYLRSAYLQRRLNLVYDGKPPKEDE